MRKRKADEVLDGARRVFLERGFDAATVDDVAAEAGVSKATVYSNFHDKHALLAALVDRVTAESAEILATALAPLDEDGSLDERLARVGLALVRGVLREEVVQLRRLAVSTATEFPESSRLYWQRGPRSTVAILTERFAQFDADGLIHCPDPRGAATLFAYAIVGPLQDRTMFDRDFAPSDSELRSHVNLVVTTLTTSWSVQPQH